MRLFERELTLPAPLQGESGLDAARIRVEQATDDGQTPIRFAVTESTPRGSRCEVGLLEGWAGGARSIFDLRPRGGEDARTFNAALIVPTGIGAAIGGHAGDATPVARLLASVCDTLITHPNVVNASDLNELPDNALYVEGSVMSRLLMGTIGLRPVRANRVLVIIDAHPEARFERAAINAVNAARATLGLDCPRVVVLDPPLPARAEYAPSGRAVGAVEEVERVFAVIDAARGECDAVALSTLIKIGEPHSTYFASRGEVVNPWGGVEAMLTHAISTLYDVPSAHAPMMDSTEVANLDHGVVDPRMAAEVISLTFFQSVLKGLRRAPRIVSREEGDRASGALTVRDVSCLVIPDGCVGLPTLAALEQGIPVIAVRENRNLMRNDLSPLPWAPGQLLIVDNYWEAAGVMAALREGLSPESLRRPFADARVDRPSPGAFDEGARAPV